jgi:glutamate mutase epsilon subunit
MERIILASCLSPKDMLEDFGKAGLLLAPLAAAGGLADFLASEFQGLHDILTGQDQYTIIVQRQAAVPVLGQPAGDFVHGQGFGEVQPATVFNGGDPTGLVQGITWSSWGGSTATGTGTSDYVGPRQIVATGTQEKVTIVAFDLGTCSGKLMYRAVEWYFPQHGQSFNPGQYEDICTGTYVGQ